MSARIRLSGCPILPVVQAVLQSVFQSVSLSVFVLVSLPVLPCVLLAVARVTTGLVLEHTYSNRAPEREQHNRWRILNQSP